MPNIVENYNCIDCNFICSKKSNYAAHLRTRKHLHRTKKCQKMPEEADALYSCDRCGRGYKARNSLWYHKQSCKSISDDVLQTERKDLPTLDSHSIMELIRQNQEFKNLLIEQNEKMMDIYKEGKVINQNNKFNLNFFLNTTCKDAINMTDFIRNMEIQMSELENIGHRGYVAGMTDLILNKLKGLEVSKRPMHCTDLKRETVYIKDQDRWDKDNIDKSQLRRAITLVAKKNYGKTLEWREQNPECLEIGSEKYDFCFSMMRNVLGDFEEEQIKMDNKVIKNLAKEVVLDRQQFD